MRRLAVATAVAMLGVWSGCGGGQSGGTIALLLPGNKPARLEREVRPQFERRVKALCGECTVRFSDARGDISRQRRQAVVALNRGVDAIVVDPVVAEDGAPLVARANARGIPVVDYEDLILDAGPAVYVSYGNAAVGRLEAEGLAAVLRRRGSPHGPIVMINGEPGNSEQPQFEAGALAGFKAAGIDIARKFFTAFWSPRKARHEMKKGIAELGREGFAGVYAETDGIAGGAIEAMLEAGIDPREKPTVGFDATVAGVRRVLAGGQYMTVYEPIRPEASAAAEAAVDLVHGNSLDETVNAKLDNGTAEVPSILLEPVAVRRDDIQRTVIAHGFISRAELCGSDIRPSKENHVYYDYCDH